MHESQQGGKGVIVEGIRVEDEIREVVERQVLDVVLAHGLQGMKSISYVIARLLLWAQGLSWD